MNVFDSERPGCPSARRWVTGLGVWLAALWAAGMGSALLAADPWQSGAGFRWRELAVPNQGRTGFALLPAAETGVTFTHGLDDLRSAGNRVLENGSGVAVGDVDGDGWPDLFFCSLEGRNALYRNLGNWSFTDVTTSAGLGATNHVCRGAVFADVNGDRWPDLLISTLSDGVLCFLNDGRGHFSDTTASAGFQPRPGTTTLALADVDGNGTLDLYVATYRSEDIRDLSLVEVQVQGGRLVPHPKYGDRLLLTPQGIFEYGEPDLLYLNDGQGHFREVPWTEGAFLDEDGKPLGAPPKDWGLTASFHDLNGDGWPDLYVCNDYWTPDRLFLNDGHGHFRAIDRLAIRHTSENSMGVDFADLDRDGQVDFLVLDMLSRDPQTRRRQVLAQTKILRGPGETDSRPQVMRNTLFHNRGDGTFEELADFAGLEASDWSWQPVFVDVDLDGYEDLLIPAGHRRDVQDLDATARIKSLQHPWPKDMDRQKRQDQFTREMMEHARLYPALDMPVIAYRNLGHLRFEEVTDQWGTETPAVHQGIALGDLDQDGDLDFVVNNLNGTASVYRNLTGAPRVAVQLIGLPPNTAGIGARITLTGGAVPSQSQEVICGGRYLSGSQPVTVFATGSAREGMTLEVRWRSGRVSSIPGVRPNRLYAIDETAAGSPAVAGASPPPPPCLFTDASDRLGHVHHETDFDDFARQPLLPRKLSQLGPGVAWFDVNGDGWEDLLLGSGKGGSLGVFLNDGRGRFQTSREPMLHLAAVRDLTTILGWNPSPGGAALLVGFSNYEETNDLGLCLKQLNLPAQQSGDLVVPPLCNTGPLALADYDGDGDLDLFVGGRCVPGRYPEPASSYLFRNDAGRWQIDEATHGLLERVGLVTGAVWSDLDGDGWPELVTTCEWGPIRILHNDRGHLAAWNPPVRAADGGLLPAPLTTLDGWSGWWAGITTGDLDGDGRLDLVAANWGLNSPYHASADRPLLLYYGDFLNRGTVDILETEFDPRRQRQTARHPLDRVAEALPLLRDRFATFKAFSEAPMGAILDALGKPDASKVEARVLASMVFLNRGDHFEAVELPPEAQWAPAFATVVADFDGDAREDVFLSQNFFALPWETPRLDAGRGLLLLGNGRGGLRAVPGSVSGVKVYGEQRGAAACDYDHDGRVDLVVSQNAGDTKLYHNQGGAPGVRVRLAGPPGNPAAIGAVLRLRYADHFGPASEIHAGSGYWSQDGATQVLGTAGSPEALWVRWPGGRETTSTLPAGTRSVTLTGEGEVKVMQ